MAALCMLLLAGVVTRQGFAKRSTDSADAALPPDVAEAIQPDDGARFDEAVQTAVADPLPTPQASEWQTVTVRNGQTLSDIFEDNGLGFSEAMAVIRLSSDAKRLESLNAGDKLLLRKTPDSKLGGLRYEFDDTHTLDVSRNDAGDLEAVTIAAELERRDVTASGTIENSLFLDGRRAGLSGRLLMQMADIFGYQIDFALDLRPGDRFTVVYEELFKDDKKLRDGNIVAAEFVNRGRSYRALRYVDADGNTAYYAPDGQSLRTAFRRAPLDFVRISSGFSLHRHHPILNTIRAHKGTDYAAPSGTPIKATGDGRVEFIGVQHGYGRVVILRHGKVYTTKYAHMSRFRKGLHVGSPVRQGQVIGYVGMSGLATAPHCHYEFRINGVAKNPVTVALPRANPLPKSIIPRWRTETAYAVAQLDAADRSRTAMNTATDSSATP